jgi:hypothetical protein
MVTFKEFISGEKSTLEMSVEEKREFTKKINEILLPRISVLTLPKQTIAELFKIGGNFAASFDLNGIVNRVAEAYRNPSADISVDKISEIPVFNYQPCVFNKEPIIFALKRLKFIADEIDKRKASLPKGKDLQVFTAFGSKEIAISQISVISNTDLEIKGLDNDGFVTVIIPHSNLSLLFREVDEFKI